jgi:hypothetical protein
LNFLSQCDQRKPECNNCLRRKTPCPGYSDVFDGAHRSQNKVVIRMVEKKSNKDGEPTIDTPSSTSSSVGSLDSVSSLSSPSDVVPVSRPRGPLHWIIYEAPEEECEAAVNNTWQLAQKGPSTPSHLDTSNNQLGLSQYIRPNQEEACINFFFNHYTGTIYDRDLHNNYAQLWQPLYLASSPSSPLRIATAAVTVNVAMMWSFKGCDARPARKLFTQALAATREAINNPAAHNMDELLMTIHVFDLYDAMILHYQPNSPVTYGRHKRGALALLKHRGEANYASETGRSLVEATRHLLLEYSLSTRIRLPPNSEDIWNHPSIPGRGASQLDVLTTNLINVQARLWDMRRRRSSSQMRNERQAEIQQIVGDAIRLDEALVEWRRSINAPSWRSMRLSRDEVPPSILAAGFYGEKCSVWVDLVAADMNNMYYARRISALQIIRQALADEPALLTDQTYRAYLAKANTTAQSLVDTILESVPAHLGDTVVPTNPIYCSEITYPYATYKDVNGQTRQFPDLENGHFRMRAAASGGWTIFPHLVNIYRLVEPEDDAEPLVLREGQLDWIKGQIKRLQTTFLYCDPVW